MKCCVLLFFITLTSVTSQAANPGWQLRQESNGVKISQKQPASGHTITRGSIEIAASIDAIVTLMRDHTACNRWLFACKQSRLVKKYDARTRLDYAVIDSPYWYADRDMYTFTTFDFNRANQTVLIKIAGKEGYDKGQPGRVRIKNLQGFWRMKEISAQRTAVLYQISSDPQLPPSRYLNKYFVDSVFRTLSNLAVVSREGKYRGAQLPELAK